MSPEVFVLHSNQEIPKIHVVQKKHEKIWLEFGSQKWAETNINRPVFKVIFRDQTDRQTPVDDRSRSDMEVSVSPVEAEKFSQAAERKKNN